MNSMKNQTLYKKIFLSLFLFSIICLLPLCMGASSPPKNNNFAIAKFIKPYVGEYKCKSLQLGNEDILQDYFKISISLQEGGKGLLVVIPKKGKRQSESFKYAYNYDTKQIEFILDAVTGDRLVTSPLQNGSFSIVKNICDKTLSLQFSM